MPVFRQQRVEKKEPGKPAGIPQEVIDEYKSYIDQLEKGSQGILTFNQGENIALARRALQQAGEESKKYVKVRKPRGEANVLQFQRITKTEWMAAKKMARDRVAKRKSQSQPKAAPKAKVKAKPKTKARPKAKKKS